MSGIDTSYDSSVNLTNSVSDTESSFSTVDDYNADYLRELGWDETEIADFVSEIEGKSADYLRDDGWDEPAIAVIVAFLIAVGEIEKARERASNFAIAADEAAAAEDRDAAYTASVAAAENAAIAEKWLEVAEAQVTIAATNVERGGDDASTKFSGYIPTAVSLVARATEAAESVAGYSGAAWARTIAYSTFDEIPDDYVSPLTQMYLGKGYQSEADDAAWFAEVEAVVDASFEVDEGDLPDNYFDNLIINEYHYSEDAVNDASSGGVVDFLEPEEFLNWHPTVQIKYLTEQLGASTWSNYTPTTSFDAENGVVVIGTSEYPSDGSEIEIAENLLAVTLSDDGREVIILNTLSYGDMLALSTTEQEKIANSAYFQEAMAPGYGLLPDSSLDIAGYSSAVEAARVAMLVVINDEISKITGVTYDDRTNGVTGETFSFNTDKMVYVEQLELIKDSLSSSAIFSGEDIAAQVSDIMERYERAAAYDSCQGFSTDSDGTGDPLVYNANNVASADGNASIDDVYKVLIEQEERILYLARSERQMAILNGLESTDSDGNRVINPMDTVSMIATLQNNLSLKQDAIVTMTTVQLEELNTLLSAYTEMQRLVNLTIMQFDDDDDEDVTKNLAVTWDPLDEDGYYTERILGMFEERTSASHPIEVELGVERPTHDYWDNDTHKDMSGPPNIAYTKADWETFLGQLTEAVKILDATIYTNDITEANRVGNTSEEQGLSLVKRQYNLNSTIARGF